jgi:hypothetical protein
MKIMSKPLGKRHAGKPKRKLYDLVYHLRHKAKRNKAAREYINKTPDYQIYQKLYSRWRYALAAGTTTIPFLAPTRKVRQALMAQKGSGCCLCGEKQNLQLDHIDHNVNQNNLDNLRWLCSECHSKETNKERLNAAMKGDNYGKIQELLKKKPHSTYEELR